MPPGLLLTVTYETSPTVGVLTVPCAKVPEIVEKEKDGGIYGQRAKCPRKPRGQSGVQCQRRLSRSLLRIAFCGCYHLLPVEPGTRLLLLQIAHQCRPRRTRLCQWS